MTINLVLKNFSLILGDLGMNVFKRRSLNRLHKRCPPNNLAKNRLGCLTYRNFGNSASCILPRRLGINKFTELLRGDRKAQ
jgi:hypothetical protein